MGGLNGTMTNGGGPSKRLGHGESACPHDLKAVRGEIRDLEN
jgi:hypothetical protein